MGILVYLIALRVKRIFDFKTHPIKTISVVLLFCVSVFYGYTFAYLYNSPNFQEKLLSHNEFKHYIILSLAIITLLRGFFPSYIPLKNIIACNYPLSKMEKFSYNIINEFIYPFYFGIILFVTTFSVLVNSGDFKFLIIAFFWIIISHFLKRLVQFLIEAKLQGINIYLVFPPILALIAFYHFFFNDMVEYFNYAISFITLTVLISLNYLFEYKGKEPKISTKASSKNTTQNLYFIKLLLNNKLLRSMSLISIVYKAFFLLMIWNLLQKNGGAFSKSEIVLYIFISPLVLFSYFFNNFFGFSRTMWLSMNKVGANVITFSKEMLKVLFVPLTIDTVLTIVILVVLDKLNYAYVSFYISNVIILFAIGVTNSFCFPKQVKSVFTMSGNTSILGNVFSLLALALIVVLTKYFIYTNIFFSFFIVLSLYFVINKRISGTRYKLFKKLFS